MNPTNAPISPTRRPLVLIVLGTALLAGLATISVLYAAGLLTPALLTRQALVHTMGSQMMPFDLDKTTHVFEMTDTGGVQRVLVKDPSDTNQIALVQQHLQHEAMQFSSGDFADPASIHGADMPGLHDLAAGASKIRVE